MVFSVVNVSAASVSKTKTATVSLGSYGSGTITDKATKNTNNGDWSFVTSAAGTNSKYSYKGYSGTFTESNNGNKCSHKTTCSVYSSGYLAYGSSHTFTYTYSESTNKIS